MSGVVGADGGSDLRGMRCHVVRDGKEYGINGTKHFISCADVADVVIRFTGRDEVDSGTTQTRHE